MNDDETRVMSRALTRGATMLDEACDGCGNPLFRYQGDVFCAVCQERSGGAEEGEDQDGTSGESEGEEVDGVGEGEVQASAGDATRARDENGTDEPDGVDESLRRLARRLADDAVENADDPEAVERRLDALERTLDLLR
ncbi:hypothetical protein EGH25_11690 [Haladaptatus sp. F3-133]|uniref:Sjogren's syndrome/scleroderma autoantigen 1 (Autoantigen p27) n=1 Tax=Halorutilus salinus TaxID=2487751 RepID=A0A9Q4GKB0_9EURY|nr:Sjogren's syndrome/scleroderma autoantigen 1 family protein [Halorutilus salinus]MCX2820011.1 hypothetical protein [Halorutilus salinus]